MREKNLFLSAGFLRINRVSFFRGEELEERCVSSKEHMLRAIGLELPTLAPIMDKWTLHNLWYVYRWLLQRLPSRSYDRLGTTSSLTHTTQRLYGFIITDLLINIELLCITVIKLGEIYLNGETRIRKQLQCESIIWCECAHEARTRLAT